MERILVVDDSLMQAQFLKNLLSDTYEVELCTSPKAAVAQAKQFMPCLILMDIIMPELSGFELLPLIKGEDSLKDIPVILISSLSEVGDEKRGLDLGAVDYIVKPYSKDIVKARVRTHVRIYNLQRSMEALMQIDPLTGIYNRRYVESVCKETIIKMSKKEQIYSLGMVDVDCFKKYNDTYGHLGGDAVLRVVAQIAKKCLEGKGCFIARYGGEEFIFGMEGSMSNEAEKMAEFIRKSIMDANIIHAASVAAPVVTVSVGGVSGIVRRGDTLETWVQKADEHLYSAKENGRNRVNWITI